MTAFAAPAAVLIPSERPPRGPFVCLEPVAADAGALAGEDVFLACDVHDLGAADQLALREP